MTTTTVFFLKSMIRLNVSRDTSCPTLYLAHMSQYGDVLRDTISLPEVNVFFYIMSIVTIQSHQCKHQYTITEEKTYYFGHEKDI